jgi:D-alanyl-D-alanine carboxypeptidase
MEDNNSSGYNCRLIAGTTQPSRHASGLAIDINPVQNPYIVGGAVYPPAGIPYLDRTELRPGMLSDGGPVVQAFAKVGWRWGGHWQEPRDYHHFELAQ